MALVQYLAISWRHLHCFQSWPPDCVTGIATLPWIGSSQNHPRSLKREMEAKYTNQSWISAEREPKKEIAHSTPIFLCHFSAPQGTLNSGADTMGTFMGDLTTYYLKAEISLLCSWQAHCLPSRPDWMRSFGACRTSAISDKTFNWQLPSRRVSPLIHTGIHSKSEKVCEFYFSVSQKSAEKVRKSRRQNFATKVRKSIKI